MLQQIGAAAIVGLLFLGANYQLFLALQPQLAGKPDYAQAFFLGLFLVTSVILAAAGFSLPRSHWVRRLGSASAFAGIGLGLAVCDYHALARG